ncbi:MAG: homoserine kinase [Chitinophagaceae bacterium]|nr:homoserine kinase [Chitinophagaceae bacterium]MCW5925976.1 homoserine kinase [Chitinophagaceae bacterium]
MIKEESILTEDIIEKAVAAAENRQCTVHAPGTVANLVCGFDVLGLALNDPYDVMTVKLIKEPTVVIHNRDNYGLPTAPEKNVAGVALLEMIRQLNGSTGFDVTIEKRIKPGSGVGSSAASSAGAVVAANKLLGNIFSYPDLVQMAMFGEKLASGVKHADNIAPCIYGGVTLIRSIHPLDIISVPSPPLFVTLVHPQIEVRTEDARQILKKQILLKDAIRQWGNIAALVTGFMKSDYDLIGRSLEDVLIEPVRSILIPDFAEVKERSLSAGALGGGISGSGPSIFMLSRDEETALRVEKEMQDVYTKTGIEYHTYVTTVNSDGCTVVND